MTGYNRWHPTTIASGNMTAQSMLGTRHSTGMIGVLRTTIIATSSKHTTIDSQKRRKIFGTSRKKFDRSTSFFVAPQVILYENKWARSAWER